MENLSGYTPTQLLKLINAVKTAHDTIKKNILDYVNKVEELEKQINGKMEELDVYEKQYVELIEELNKRENVIR
jgi:cell division septum initiation protein DivIVA